MMKKLILLTQRKASLADSHLLFRWRNDPDVRRASFRTNTIQLNEHVKWLIPTLNNPAVTIYILEQKFTPVGMFRLDRKGVTATVDISVDTKFRGRGIGKIIISKLILTGKNIGIKKLIAEVKENNIPSKKLFLASGFVKVKEGVKFGIPYSSYEFNVWFPRNHGVRIYRFTSNIALLHPQGAYLLTAHPEGERFTLHIYGISYYRFFQI